MYAFEPGFWFVDESVQQVLRKEGTIGFGRRSFKGPKGFDLRGKDEFTVFQGPIDRLDPQRIAYQQEFFFLLVHKCEGEHAIELRESIRAIGHEPLEEDFSVASGLEFNASFFLQNGSELLEIVQFAVEYQAVSLVFRKEGLIGTRIQIDDGQTGVAQTEMLSRIELACLTILSIWPSMVNGGQGRSQRMRFFVRNVSDYTAHRKAYRVIMSSSKRTMAKGTLERYSAQEKFGRPHLLIRRAVFVPLKKACKANCSLRCIK
ncbi:MAG: Uncharacterised protein [Flavobacteriia bacterium]|nr:MAG: Uncharacterised protein [Flavobacteriia bacterium]